MSTERQLAVRGNEETLAYPRREDVVMSGVHLPNTQPAKSNFLVPGSLRA